ncbi:glycerophosphodiester phosphodiesterase family protein [Allorhizocola rhizosphaerae]|uniref:glycerophosphodiester phosphodiesterase family protein n=1 Tax=Allorhizocola rhizosphaerae TaxID=1872709 RepID=UPI000E3DC86D|nr:glycerophosphodiester phosphodiesterase family protein [Allorhizocola rhizosphaerae]
MLASRPPIQIPICNSAPVAYLEEPPLAFAHRGGAAEGDENTAEAFARAIAAGYRYVETDVHATADGVPVLIHDPPDPALSYQDLLRTPPPGGPAPRLDEVLDRWPGIKFNIDVKADAAVTPTVAAIEATGAHDRVLLASFSDTRLRRLRALTANKIATSLGQREVARLWAASRIGAKVSMPASVVAVQVPVRHRRLRVVDRRFLALAHALGLQVHVWTVDDPDEMAGLLDLGVDGIMTDRINILKDVFTDRGLWK